MVSGSRCPEPRGSPLLAPKPLKPFSLPAYPACQGGAEDPVPVPGQAVPRVPGRGRPGGHLPAGPAAELCSEEDVRQQPGCGEEESPLLPDQAADGEWGPVLMGWGPPTRPQGELSRRTSSELSSRPEGTGSQPPRSTEEEAEAQGSTVTRPSLRPKPQLLGLI